VPDAIFDGVIGGQEQVGCCCDIAVHNGRDMCGAHVRFNVIIARRRRPPNALLVVDGMPKATPYCICWAPSAKARESKGWEACFRRGFLHRLLLHPIQCFPGFQ
jgi:hypothetical protein